MILDFISLTIKNFKTIHQMKFRLALSAGVHLIVGDNEAEEELGSNGAGKSSIFDALCWVCYGKTPDGKRGPDLVPWNTEETVSVKLLLETDEEKHTLYRTHSPNRLSWDDQDVDQAFVEAKLGINFDTFIHTILLGQALPLFFDLTPTQKMKLFTDVLSLDAWYTRSTTARKAADDIQTNLSETEGWLSGVVERKQEQKTLISSLEKQSSVWEKEQKVLQREREKKLVSLRTQLTHFQDIHDKNDLAYDSALTELKPAQKQLKQLDDYIRNRSRDLADQDDIKRQLKAAQKGRCPVCGGPLKDDKHLKELEAQLKKHKAAEISVEDLEEKFVITQAAVDKFQDKADKAREALDRYIPQLAEVKSELKLLEKSSTELVNPYTSQIVQVRKALKALMAEVADAEKDVRIWSHKHLRTRYWVQGFKDLELYLIDDVLHELELASNAMLEQLGLVDWAIHYTTESETKSGQIKRGLAVFIQSPHNDNPVRWECWSGGEKQRLKLIGALALSEVLLTRAGIEPLVEILDEPSSHLSNEGVADLCEFLANRARQLGRTIFYVDQTAIESALFASTINVVRTEEEGSACSR